MGIIQVRQKVELLAIGTVELHPGLVKEKERVERCLRKLARDEQVVEVFFGFDVDEDLVLNGAHLARDEKRQPRGEKRSLQRHQGFAAPGVPRSPSP